MRRRLSIPKRNGERGVVILLVAIFLLFVVGAMAVLSIDLVTFYTARSEAQLAADGAALAAARVLANSGMTSNPSDTTLSGNAETLARTIAQQVGMHNEVGGRNLTLAEVNVSFNDGDASFGTNPHVTVQVTRADLPTFFARIWGRATVTVSSTAIAEAYNPSGADFAGGTTTPIAPICVKPWLLPNIDPTSAPNRIFDPADGDIVNNGLLGYEANAPPTRLRTACTTNCAVGFPPPSPPAPQAWQYYPGDTTITFLPPSTSSVACSGSAGFTPYQLSVAGCVQTPIACNQVLNINIDTTSYPTRDTETGPAVNCLAHSAAGNGDKVDDTAVPTPPFQFAAGDDNPAVQIGALATGTDVFVSSSLVTVPVFDSDSAPWPPVTYPNVQIVGFVQLFLEPDGNAVPANGRVRTKVINLVGCGTAATGQAILGNGASAVPVRLIAPP